MISGNFDTGLEIQDAATTGNTVRGNYIGTNATGTAALGNLDGVIIEDSPNNTIGGTMAGAGNLISGNSGAAPQGNGVVIFGVDASGNAVHGNRIGTDVTGLLALANTGSGIRISDRGDGGAIKGAAHDNAIGGTTPGAGNVIAFNTGNGVTVDAAAGTGNAIRQNAIHSNAGLGIDLSDNGVTANDLNDPDNGPNNRQNFPVLAAATVTGTSVTITGTINSTASTTFQIDYFSNSVADGSGFGEGRRYLGSATVNSDGSGNANVNVTLNGVTVAAGEMISATATDSNGNTSEFSAVVAAAIANTAPVATNDTFVTNEDTPITILAAAGVLANDSDADGDTLKAVLVSGPSLGALTLNADGSFVYTPNANAFGSDSFTYRANDGVANSNVATVTITVNSVNDAPVANYDSFLVNKNNLLNVGGAGMLTNDGDVDGDPLTVVLIGGPASGLLALNPDGTFSYTPDADFDGVDSFSYVVTDGVLTSNTATVTIAVNLVGGAPTPPPVDAPPPVPADPPPVNQPPVNEPPPAATTPPAADSRPTVATPTPPASSERELGRGEPLLAPAPEVSVQSVDPMQESNTTTAARPMSTVAHAVG